jgi:hypothetical protein
MIFISNHTLSVNTNKTIYKTSVTTSVISALIGITVDQGSIHCIKQEVLDYFTEYKIKWDEK